MVSIEFSESDWDLMRYYRLGSFNLIELRSFLRKLLNCYLNGGVVDLKKEHADCIFRFLQQSNLGYVNPNKNSKSFNHDK